MDIEWPSEVNILMGSDNSFKTQWVEEIFGLDKGSNSLLQALTHPSVLNESRNTYMVSYERMEFLGDALIDLVVANELYTRLPQAPEGELSKLRASIVNGNTLAKIAKELQLSNFIIMGQGSGDSGGRERLSTLANVLEALLGAVLIEKGIVEAYNTTLRILENELLQNIKNGVREDPKNLLQHLTQSKGKGEPIYNTISESGPSHSKIFTVEVLIEGESVGTGIGSRKVDSERMAATKALKLINGINNEG